MKTLIPSLAVLTLLSSFAPAAPLGTAFTYQGRLTAGAEPADGIYDLRFTLYDVATGGNSIGGPLTNAATAVSNGLFSVPLDFGSGVFTGEARWLEIGVRPAGGGTFAPLAPRQQLTAAPYAIYAPSAGWAASADSVAAGNVTGTLTLAQLPAGVVTNGAAAVTLSGAFSGSGSGLSNVVQVNSDGFVGLGTNATQAGLQLASGPTVYQPNIRFEVGNNSGGFTNLALAWGVAVSPNHLLAVTATSSRLTLVDISNPAAPVLRAQLSDGSGGFNYLANATGVAIKDNILAVAAYYDNAVTLINLANPGSPARISEVRDGVGPFTLLGGAYEVAFSSNNLLAVSAVFDDAVTLVNVSNPAAPALAGYLQNGFSGFTYLNGPRQLVFSGHLLAVAAADSSAVTLVDVSAPANPQLRAVLRDGVGGFDGLDGANGLAISANNLLAIAALDEAAVTLVDVSDPASPQLRAVLRDGVGGFDSLGSAIRVAFSGNLLAISARSDNALTLVDVTVPTAPVLKGVFRNGQAGVNYLSSPVGLVFDGNTLAVAGNGGSLALLQPTPVQVNLTAKDLVGIGTASPQAPLHVVGNVVVQDAGIVALDAKRFELGVGATAAGDHSVAMGQRAQAQHDGTFVWADATSGYFTSTGSDQFLVRATGGVGINKNNPASALDVNGTVKATGLAVQSSTMAVHYGTNALLGGAYGWRPRSSGVFLEGSSGGEAGGFYADGDVAVIWSPGDPDLLRVYDEDYLPSGDPLFVINGSGRVGILTHQPQAALHVNGTVRANRFESGGSLLRLGTWNDQPLELEVGGTRALRLEPNATSPNLIGGHLANAVSAGVVGATISGGGANWDANTVAANYGTIGGGTHNTIATGAEFATISGGLWNTIQANADRATIGGGDVNAVQRGAFEATIGGGRANTAGAENTTISGGWQNVIHTNAVFAVIGGGDWNLVQTNAQKATIGGGEGNIIAASTEKATIGGGERNHAGGFACTIAGGRLNTNAAEHTVIGGGLKNYVTGGFAGIPSGADNAARGFGSVVSGGRFNVASNDHAVVGGGFGNKSLAYNTTVSGGENNAATGAYSTVPGGRNNAAAGSYAHAAGRRAKADHTGAFVWGDSTDADIASAAANSWTVRASGGTRIFSNAGASVGVQLAGGGNAWSATSDRNVKENFRPVDPKAVLEKVAALPVTEWNLKSQSAEIRHIGPMAQDFKAAFGLGEDDRHISTSDADGVALAAIQGLNQKLEEQAAALRTKDLQIQALQQRLEALEQRLSE